MKCPPLRHWDNFMLSCCPCVQIYFYYTGESESLSRRVHRCYDGHWVSVRFLAAGFGGLLSMRCAAWLHKTKKLVKLHKKENTYISLWALQNIWHCNTTYLSLLLFTISSSSCELQAVDTKGASSVTYDFTSFEQLLKVEDWVSSEALLFRNLFKAALFTIIIGICSVTIIIAICSTFFGR